jgi:hypothetical protein
MIHGTDDLAMSAPRRLARGHTQFERLVFSHLICDDKDKIIHQLLICLTGSVFFYGHVAFHGRALCGLIRCSRAASVYVLCF